ncbi:cytochrome d ubiquinol oxidase subunit II [Peribacillus sp. NPDC060186]
MSYELLGITVLWTFLYGYVIVASIDFGAGFFNYYSSITGKGPIIHKVINRYLSPVWEVTNVFLVFFYVGLIGFFPLVAYYYGTTLLIPGSIATILLAIRGSYYAFHHYGPKKAKWTRFLYGATGLLIPASLSIVLTISEGGYINVSDDSVTLDYGELFTSMYSWTVIILAIVSVLYISACFLTYYAHKAGDTEAFDILRRYALSWSLPTIIASFLVFLSISTHNWDHFSGMLDLFWMFILSSLFFIGGVYLIWKKQKLGLSFIFVMLQFATAFYGYGAAHLPYLLYPYLSIHDGFTNEAMAVALIITFLAGLLLLIPSLYLLMRLFLFNNKYVHGEK